jgi:hypothetical protein
MYWSNTQLIVRVTTIALRAEYLTTPAKNSSSDSKFLLKSTVGDQTNDQVH